MKRLIICADGTWNFRDQQDDTKHRHATNVTKIARAILPRASDGTHQIVIYHDGVGTQKGVDHLLGGATGEGIEGNIHHFHLLQKCDDFFVPELFKAYEDRKDLGAIKAEPKFNNLHEVTACPPIKFLGVWDTVGALGAPGPLGDLINGNRFTYHDIELNPNVQNAYHALALDEQRVPFKPSLWTRPPTWTGRLEQTWFCGVHGNVGGGYSPDGLANEALH